ncbi:hypothetical protein V6N13_126849 [Hibiscus sabdariffa]
MKPNSQTHFHGFRVAISEKDSDDSVEGDDSYPSLVVRHQIGDEQRCPAEALKRWQTESLGLRGSGLDLGHLEPWLSRPKKWHKPGSNGSARLTGQLKPTQASITGGGLASQGPWLPGLPSSAAQAQQQPDPADARLHLVHHSVTQILDLGIPFHYFISWPI